MLLFVLILLFAAGIEVPKMFYERHWRDLFVFTLITIIGIVLGILIQMQVRIPYVGVIITRLVEKFIINNFR